ncbi:MAG: hypothetical protein ABSE92_16555 [Terriglobales bacterium]
MRTPVGASRSANEAGPQNVSHSLQLRHYICCRQDYDHNGTTYGPYLPCTTCGKRHDPKNRVLQLGYQAGKYCSVEAC